MVEALFMLFIKRFQVGQDRIKRKLEEVVTRLGSLEVSVASVRRDIAHNKENTATISVRVDRLIERLDRIERRLELSCEPAQNERFLILPHTGPDQSAGWSGSINGLRTRPVRPMRHNDALRLIKRVNNING